MSIWKNTEVRRTALWLLLATAVCSVAAALLYPACGLLTLGLGAVCGAIWYGSTRRRYRELERMSRDIDRILHGQEQQMLPQQEEGELAILRSEIGKMTVRLRENGRPIGAMLFLGPTGVSRRNVSGWRMPWRISPTNCGRP